MTERAAQTHPNATQTRFTVAEAASLLGLSAEAVRSRVQRGTLASTKVGGTVYVLLDSDHPRPNAAQTSDESAAQARLSGDQTAFIASLQGQIDWLRREVERKDTLLMALMQRIPELEAPPEPREGSLKDSDGAPSTRVPPDEEKRSWWRRLFEG